MSETFQQPHAVVSGPEDRQSLWQPLPSRGHVIVKFSPANTPSSSKPAKAFQRLRPRAACR